MEKIIKVECMDEFTLMNHYETEILAEVKKGEYVAELYEESGEYFAKDIQGREFLVGEIDIDGNIVLQDEFRISGSDRVIVLKVTDELGTHTLNSSCFIVKCCKCKKERELVESDLKEGKVMPRNCECGGKNKFHYWLDNVYTEEEYKELEIMSELKVKAIELFKENPEEIGFNLLQRHLRIGVIKVNKLLEALENDGVISPFDKNEKRRLLIG